MQFIGWISILTGLLYFNKIAGILLIIIGTALVYIEWKSKKSKSELSRRMFQEQIKNTRIKKAVPGMTQQSERDFLINALPKTPNISPQRKNIKKAGWFIYTK